METDFSADGYWWDSSKPDKKYGGILEYKKDSYTRLRLFGTLNDWFKGELYIRKIDTIHGKTSDGKQYTLFRNLVESSNSILFKSTGGYLVMIATYLLEGHHFQSYDDVVLDSISCNLSNLDNWLNIDLFSKSYDRNDNSIKLTFNPICIFQKNIESINSKLEIYLENRVEKTNNKLSLGIPFIKIAPVIKQSLDWFIGKIYDLQNLLTLFVGEQTRRNIITAAYSSPVRDMKDDSKVINIFLNNRTKFREMSIDKMLIPSKLIKEKLGEILEKWFLINNEIRQDINTFLSSFNNDQENIETRFLNCVFSLEGIYRYYKINDTKKDSVKSILKEATLDLFSGIESNYISLFIKNQDTFAESVRLYRNHLAHQNRDTIIPDLHDLMIFTLRLQLFMNLKLLKMIGIEYEIMFKRIGDFGLFSSLSSTNAPGINIRKKK